MQEGFITALGTPIDETGELVAESFRRHMTDQLDAGASALLVMGTMGNEAYIRDRVYPTVARVAVEETAGRVPVLVGVMDCSIRRVLDRIEAIGNLAVDGVVATAPYYLKPTQPDLIEFFTSIADASSRPLYLYDLPPVAQVAIAPETVRTLMHHPNIKGIKSGVLPTCRLVRFAEDRPDGFEVMYSGLDTFDAAWSYGLRYNLDGMFACTPVTADRMYAALKRGDIDSGREALDRILALRDAFLEIGVLRGFTAAMHILGYAGSFAPDYVTPPTPKEVDEIRTRMQSLGIAV